MGSWQGRHALIFLAGPETEYDYIRRFLQETPDVIVVCADGGLRHARALGLYPDLMISDCDSMAETEGTEVIRLTPEKDDTDAQACLRQAIARNCRAVTFVCATGGRLDHTLANLLLLEEAAQAGVQGTLLDRQNKVVLHGGGTMTFKKNSAYPYFSILPLDRILTGVTIIGAKYPLTNADVSRIGPITVSNEAVADEVSIVIKTGRALVLQCRDSR